MEDAGVDRSIGNGYVGPNNFCNRLQSSNTELRRPLINDWVARVPVRVPLGRVSGNIVRGSVRAFFFGKKETLAQGIVQGLITSVFAGLVVATLATLLSRQVEVLMDRAESRAALDTLRHGTLSSTLNEISAEYAGLDCARTLEHIGTPDCKNRLDSLISLLVARKDLLTALLPASDFSEMDDLVVKARELHRLREGVGQQDHGDEMAKAFSDQYLATIAAIAAHYH